MGNAKRVWARLSLIRGATKRKMSIRLCTLLELSHELSVGRLRRREWEDAAEKMCRRKLNRSVGVLSPAGSATPAMDVAVCGAEAEDAADMLFLDAVLRGQGLAPRPPSAEAAMLRLLLASNARKMPDADFAEPDDTCAASCEELWGGRCYHAPRWRHNAESQQAVQRLAVMLNALPVTKTDRTASVPSCDDDAWIRALINHALVEAENEELAHLRGTEARSESNVKQMSPPPPIQGRGPSGGLGCAAEGCTSGMRVINDNERSAKPTPALVANKNSHVPASPPCLHLEATDPTQTTKSRPQD